MKIKYDIQEIYKENEIHLCGRDKNEELAELYQGILNLTGSVITAYNGGEAVKLSYAQIARIYSENKKVYVRTREKSYEVKERLYSLEERLPSGTFIRISNSEMINSDYIKRLDMSISGTIKLTLKNGDETYVSRRYVKTIKDALLGGR